MKIRSNLSKFSIEELKRFKEVILQVESKDSLLETVDSIIERKKEKLNHGMNSEFLVDWFNIDRANIDFLHANGIDNLAQ